MNELPGQRPKEATPPQELRFGEEFSPFSAITLPQQMDWWMELREWQTEAFYEDDFQQRPPTEVPFTLDGVNGKFFLFAYGDTDLYSIEQPLGPARKVVSFSSTEYDQSNSPREIHEQAPLGFALVFNCFSLEEVERVQRLRLELKLGNKVYDVRGNDMFDRGDLNSEEVNDDLNECNRVVIINDSNNFFKDGQPCRQVLLPWDDEALKTIKGTFFNDVTPAFPPTETT